MTRSDSPLLGIRKRSGRAIRLRVPKSQVLRIGLSSFSILSTIPCFSDSERPRPARRHAAFITAGGLFLEAWIKVLHVERLHDGIEGAMEAGILLDKLKRSPQLFETPGIFR